MRFLPALLVLVLAPALRAQEKAEPVTTLFPKASKVCLRLPSLDRLDELAREFGPMIQGIDPQTGAMLRRLQPSASVVHEMGLDAEVPFHRGKPIFVALVDGDPVYFVPTEAGDAWEGRRALGDRLTGVVRNGTICVGESEHLDLPLREQAAPFLEGDMGVKVFVGELVTENQEEIDQGFAQAVQQMGMVGAMLPAYLRPVLTSMFEVGKVGLEGIESFEYTITWRGDVLESEGMLRVRDGSRLRAFLGRAGAPDANPLVEFLPAKAFAVVDMCVTPDWPGREIQAFLAASLGEETGKALLAAQDLTTMLWDQTTGRVASSVSMEMMSVSALSILEGREGADLDGALRAWNPGSMNEALAKLNMSVEYQADVEKYGETAVHGMKSVSEMPAGGPFAAGGKQEAFSYFAVVNNLLLSSAGQVPEPALNDLKKLIDRVRKNERTKDHPHQKAMDRLGRTHNVGFSINVGALKPFGFMMAMMMPQMGTALAAMPDELYMSTAVTVRDGHVHWRGNWPLREIGKMAESVAKQQRAQAVREAKPEEEDFE